MHILSEKKNFPNAPILDLKEVFHNFNLPKFSKIECEIYNPENHIRICIEGGLVQII